MTTRRFNIQYFIYYLGMGVYFPFIGLYFENNLGFTGSQIGTILGMGPIIMMISLPLFGMISDKSKKPKMIIFVLTVVASILAILIRFNFSFASVLLIILLFEFFKGPLMHLNDSLTMKIIKRYKFNYSGIRTYGSIGFIVGSLVIGYLIKDIGLDSMFLFVSLSIILSGLIVLSFPVVEVEKDQVSMKRELPKLITNRNFIFIILIACLTFVTSDIENAYNGIFISKLGGSMKQVGYATIFTVFFELVLMRYNKKLLDKFGLKKVLFMAVLAVSIRYIVSFLSVNIWMFYIAISMHGVAVALVLPTALFYISGIVPKRLNATAIAFYGSISALIRAIISFGTGYIYQQSNLQSAYLAVGILSLLAIPLITYLKPIND
ncbi:MFS transporter [Mycoplasmatota bacterium WC44]